jgi:arabinofuranosyltransferase
MPRALPRLLLVAQLALVGAVLAQQFPHWWEQRWVQDDAYVSFRYARNAVRGEGLVYNPGERVEGYTNFLWTALATVPLARGAEDPLPFLHAASAALWWASFALLVALGVALWAEGLWAAPLLAVPLAVHWSFNLWFFSGMETPLVTFCTIAAVAAMTLDPRRHAWAPTVASLAAVALVMTRPDGVVVFAALLLVAAWLDRDWWRRHPRAALAAVLPVVLLLAPYQAWRLWYYGAVYPNTYYAKAAYLPYWRRGVSYLAHYVWIYHLWPFFVLLGAGGARTPLARRFLFAALAASAAVALYVARLGGDFMEWRFVTPVSGVLYPAIVVAGAAWGERWRGRGAGWLTGALTAALLTWATVAAEPAARTRNVPDQETIAMLRRYTDPGRFDWRAAAAVFDAVLPRDARVATTSAGIIPFFCDRHTLDLHGLTDAAIARTPIDPERRGRMGHEHWLQDQRAIRARGVDVILEWADPHPYPRAAARPPGEVGELVSVRLADGRFIDFTLLDPALKPRLTDPRLVFHDASAIADARRPQALPAALAGWRVVDRLDIGDAGSEAAHDVQEVQPADTPYAHSYHTKLLSYLPPREAVRLEDHGRRVWGALAFAVHDVDAQRDLALVVRYDHTGGARYRVEVNGRDAPETLDLQGRPGESWGEGTVIVPHALLVGGTNTVRLVRDAQASSRDAELYHLWFLQ